MVPARDESVNIVFEGRALHTLVEKQHVEVSATKQAEAESVDSSSVEAKDTEDEMIVRRNMMANRFLHGGCPIV